MLPWVSICSFVCLPVCLRAIGALHTGGPVPLISFRQVRSIAIETCLGECVFIYILPEILLSSVCQVLLLTRAAPLVKEARRLRTIRIVRLEWLEDSLMGKSRRPLDTRKYEFEHRKMPKHRKPRNQPQQVDDQTRESSDESGVRLPGVASRKDKMRKLKSKKKSSHGMERVSESEKLEISGKTRMVDWAYFVQQFAD